MQINGNINQINITLSQAEAIGLATACEVMSDVLTGSTSLRWPEPDFVKSILFETYGCLLRSAAVITGGLTDYDRELHESIAQQLLDPNTTEWAELSKEFLQ